ncbi:MAG TPA: hypothetical protein VMU81_05595 [Acetobacteraceae bacterium]|jgi:hypothetical protein|nr:hypothetical protein [Acetobacteraceae bacterium]
MLYLPPFEKIKAMLHITDDNGTSVVTGSFGEFLDLVRALLACVQVDEAWYLNTYADVAQAIEEGKVANARDHFINDGYFEGRWPFAIVVDERWYLAQNPGVAEYIRSGQLRSAQQHFDHDGYREGRLPFGL